MKQPKICAVISSNQQGSLSIYADIFELRIDLIGPDWPRLAHELQGPWIATNRRAEEGGGWHGSEAGRIATLMKALDSGASIVDIELATPCLEDVVVRVKEKSVCLLSYHNFDATPPLEELQDVVHRQVAAGAGICKIATMARCMTDNITILELIKSFPEIPIVAVAMGEAGQVSRILGPLLGALFGYASLSPEECSSAGQLTVEQMKALYGVICR